MNETHNNLNLAWAEAMPDGQGGRQPVPSLMTEQEVIRFLRLDAEDGCDPAQTLARYRNAGQLVAIDEVLLPSR